MNQHIVQLNFPITLRAFFDSDGDIIGTSAIPYQMPFAKLSPFVTVNFNIDQVVSFAEPSSDLVEQYEKIFDKVTTMHLKMTLNADKDKTVSQDDMSSDIEDIEIDVLEPYSTMIH
jgi:hypothetical protein